MDLSFAIAAGPRQRSFSQVRVPRDSWPHITVSDSRLPQPGKPGPLIYIPQEQGGPVITPGIGFLFHRLPWLAGLRWRYSTQPPHIRWHTVSGGQRNNQGWWKRQQRLQLNYILWRQKNNSKGEIEWDGHFIIPTGSIMQYQQVVGKFNIKLVLISSRNISHMLRPLSTEGIWGVENSEWIRKSVYRTDWSICWNKMCAAVPGGQVLSGRTQHGIGAPEEGTS
jgi:hypothetical protein